MASPVMLKPVMRCCSIAFHTSSASNFGISTNVLPLNRLPNVPHCAAPCMSGAITMPRPSSVDAAAALLNVRSSAYFSPVSKEIPPPRTRMTSSCRHTTPLGIPVVPPV
jgi:hypothetical protein